jgi:hypothetical protein
LANIKFGNKYLANRHFANWHKTNWHFANWHFVVRHLADAMVGQLSYDTHRHSIGSLFLLSVPQTSVGKVFFEGKARHRSPTIRNFDVILKVSNSRQKIIQNADFFGCH